MQSYKKNIDTLKNKDGRKIFTAPAAEVIRFDSEDVICTSGEKKTYKVVFDLFEQDNNKKIETPPLPVGSMNNQN